jgi:hypothetical protein
MVEDAHDPDRVPLHVVEDAMPPMREAADCRFNIRVRHSCVGMVAQQIERSLEASEISFGGCVAKLRGTIF